MGTRNRGRTRSLRTGSTWGAVKGNTKKGRAKQRGLFASLTNFLTSTTNKSHGSGARELKEHSIRRRKRGSSKK